MNSISQPERAKVPYDLSDAIREACEAALNANVPEQIRLSSDRYHGGSTDG
jgi:hypothetical protein